MAPFHAFDIQSDNPCAVSPHGAERRHVQRHHRPCAHHHQFADTDELVYAGQSPHHSAHTDLHMPCYGHAVGQNHFIFNHTIVRHVRVRHEQTLFANDRASALGSAAVERNAFAHNRPVADNDFGFFVAVLEVLRRGPDKSVRMNLASGSDLCKFDDRMRSDARLRPDADIFADDSVRTNFSGFGYFCGRMNDSGGMYARRG